MNDINFYVKIIAWSWGIFEFFLFITTGNASYKKDKGSFFINLIIISCLLYFGVPYAIKTQSLSNSHIIPIVGMIFSFFGFLIQIISIRTLNNNFSVIVRTFEEQTLIDYGIYKYIRHPIYTGYLLIIIGLFLGFNNLKVGVVFFIVVLLGIIYRIYVEEIELKEHFGENYINYIKRTKKLIPWIF